MRVLTRPLPATTTARARRPHSAARTALALIGGAALLLSTLAATPASADRDPHTVPKLLDVPPDHPWRHDTRLALSTAKALPGTSAARGHRLAVRNLVRSSPPALREHVSVGPVHRGRFTLTIVGDQACAIWHGRSHTAKPGPCRAADRMPLRQPLRLTASVLTFLVDDSLESANTPRERRQLVRLLFERRTLANISWTYAPHGVGIAGFVDDDHDGLDDDARITLHGRGRAVCVRFQVFKGERSTFRPGICRNLAPRPVDYPGGR